MPSPSTAASKPRTRDPWFDNAKMALVTLVVVGHTIPLLPSTGLNDHLYDFLYAWHVPAFVLVTGYLSRSFEWERRRMWQLVRTVVVPYVIFECALALFRIHVGGEQLEDLFSDPHWPMWYLSALFFWRLLTPVFKRLPAALPVALLISLAAGLYAGDTLDLARVLGLLPFFVMGLLATPERFERLRTAKVQVAAVLVFAGIWVLTTWTDRWAATEWLYYRSRYADLDVSDSEAFVIRAVVLMVGTLGAWAFLALVPRVGGWFTRMGAWTLVVYLFHGFAVKGADYAGYPDWAADHGTFALLVTVVAAVALSFLLAWEPVARRLNHLVDPVGYAERHLHQAHATANAKAEADVISEAVEDAATMRAMPVDASSTRASR
ncbi:MAG TPA: acyltransferase family protein [Nocardioides sp.]|uniref:acyltransferase family protein n=1 Tax=Nocardioides sp. TaxID=35761 RepID=UPI002BE915DB|nr:acyltransferase family protein [Nocardioides sp.]HTW17888.1 acyltransferase family protein [Nocardioides sp.]